MSRPCRHPSQSDSKIRNRTGHRPHRHGDARPDRRRTVSPRERHGETRAHVPSTRDDGPAAGVVPEVEWSVSPRSTLRPAESADEVTTEGESIGVSQEKLTELLGKKPTTTGGQGSDHSGPFQCIIGRPVRPESRSSRCSTLSAHWSVLRVRLSPRTSVGQEDRASRRSRRSPRVPPPP